MKAFVLSIFMIIQVHVVFAQSGVIKDVTCLEAFEIIQLHADDQDFVIIDLRPENLFMDAHIQGAIFFDVFSEQFNSWVGTLDKNKTYLLYCTMGQRSKAAFDKMKSMGFKHLYHMNEGITTWAGEGYKTVKINSELPLVNEAINNVIGWAVKKDFRLFLSTIADDAPLLNRGHNRL